MGCDTTSRIYGLGKERVLKTDKMKEACKLASPVFYDSRSKKEDFQKAGEKLMLTLLGRSQVSSLDEARAKVFMEKIDGKQVVKPESLPPTTHCASFHFYRVYCQLQEWLGNPVLPHGWGWVESNGKYYPVFMTNPAAPDYLLQYVWCGCKADKCNRITCSCNKHGKIISLYFSFNCLGFEGSKTLLVLLYFFVTNKNVIKCTG